MLSSFPMVWWNNKNNNYKNNRSVINCLLRFKILCIIKNASYIVLKLQLYLKREFLNTNTSKGSIVFTVSKLIRKRLNITCKVVMPVVCAFWKLRRRHLEKNVITCTYISFICWGSYASLALTWIFLCKTAPVVVK